MSEELRKTLGVDENKPNDWFEALYAGSDEGGQGVPWANMAPHPLFKKWITEYPLDGSDQKALVVGCGMGDDAIALESAGFEVTAFDVSQSAIDLCKTRFPNSKVNFVQADLLQGVPEWHQKFDFVLEIFTIQALPPKYEDTLIQNVSDLVSKNGKVVIITEVQQEKRSFENGPPWLLNDHYRASFEKYGLTQVFLSNDAKPEMGDEIHLTVFQRKN